MALSVVTKAGNYTVAGKNSMPPDTSLKSDRASRGCDTESVYKITHRCTTEITNAAEHRNVLHWLRGKVLNKLSLLELKIRDYCFRRTAFLVPTSPEHTRRPRFHPFEVYPRCLAFLGDSARCRSRVLEEFDS